MNIYSVWKDERVQLGRKQYNCLSSLVIWEEKFKKLKKTLLIIYEREREREVFLKLEKPSKEDTKIVIKINRLSRVQRKMNHPEILISLSFRIQKQQTF